MSYKASPWQQKFHDLTTHEALGGGSAGGGKSVGLVGDVLPQIIIQHKRCSGGTFKWGRAPGWALHARKEFPRLEETIDRCHRLFSDIDPEVKWEANAHRFTFVSGYKFSFGHLKDKDSYLNYRSKELTHLGFDELGEIDDKNTYDQMCTRVRTTDPVLREPGKPWSLKIRSMTNPAPNWVREYFVDPNPDGGEIFVKRVRLSNGTYRDRTRIFLKARLSDNPDKEFAEDYEANLRGQPDHIKKALLDGDWYVVPGAYFADLWEVDRVVIDPFRIPSGWHRFRTGDWGYKQECVILWWAVSSDGDLICYREKTFNGMKAKKRFDAGEVAREIRDIEQASGEWNNMRKSSRLSGWMDSQLWEERGRKGPTMADDMAREGVYWQKATKGRRSAAQQLVRRLGQRGVNGRAGIQFFRSCGKCISTIPALPTDETDPEVPAKGGPDHWYDAVSYACAANPVPSGQEDRNPIDDVWEDRPPPAQRGQYGYGLW